MLYFDYFHIGYFLFHVTLKFHINIDYLLPSHDLNIDPTLLFKSK